MLSSCKLMYASYFSYGRSFWWLRVLVPCSIMTESLQSYILQSFNTSNLEYLKVCFYVSMVSLSFMWTSWFHDPLLCCLSIPLSNMCISLDASIFHRDCKWTQGSAILMLNAPLTVFYKG